ncbi:MAG: hypothetical protein NTZ05_00710 [Chloroflexi bacterium]|nr:hypothetical protein [Chloroflexota bacterium]
MSKLTIQQRGTPILRHTPCTLCGEGHYLWNPEREQYQCVRCRGILFFDADSGGYESRDGVLAEGARGPSHLHTPVNPVFTTDDVKKPWKKPATDEGSPS